MAHIYEYEIVGVERFTSKKGEIWVKIHMIRDEGDEDRVNTILMKEAEYIYNIHDIVNVIEYAGRTQIIQ